MNTTVLRKDADAPTGPGPPPPPPRAPTPHEHPLEARTSLGAEQRLQPGQAGARDRRVGEDEGGGRPRHSSWNRYTMPAGASADSSTRGSAASSTRANVWVLAAMSSSSVSTGVASACTPLAKSVA
jgi:hypothetical protein